ncbi:peptidoglycan/xylan/chitin deacetylase (PgdA/CDA1 family) [Kitasatospora sp. MAP12-15]|uniref:polysaccharide deacetylase family protein n=1 Tax=unclassified Kitasatospora TaxID=2633591 RepID=UPI0024741060|nr:polysaccharide deacetylase family protein [Kitasatospora sp. MAP12-44]MDH6109076.1 peptidoglycan/xylan/chitin deacetylase (PgdA/CDA1 family) [Kitasatospora sp. MAP12-44]
MPRPDSTPKSPTGPLTDHSASAAGGPSGRLNHWLRYSPAQPLFRAHAARRLAVLAYRRVTDRRRFGAQLDRLCRTATPISLRTLEQAVAQRRPLPPRSVLITFDDADRGVLEHALPALEARGLPAVAFVVTELIGTELPCWRQEAAFLTAHGGQARALTADGQARRLAQLAALPDPDRRRSLHELRVSTGARPPRQQRLTPQDLRVLAAARVAIGSQSLGAAELRRCDDATVRTEIASAHQALTGWLGTAPTAFAYPGGGYEPRAAEVLRELGYRLGFLTDHRLSRRLPEQALLVSRLRVDAAGGRDHFDTVLSGLDPALSRWRG